MRRHRPRPSQTIYLYMTFTGTFSTNKIQQNVRLGLLSSLVYPCYGALFYAIQKENLEMINLCISLGADVNDPLLFQSFYCTAGAARSLLQAGASAITLFENGSNIRRILMEKWGNDLLQQVCDSIPEDIKIPRMDSSLGWAALLGNELLARFLIDRGAEVTDRIVKYARRNGHTRLAETLRQVVHLNDSRAADKQLIKE